MHSSRTAARGEGRRSSAIAVSPSLSSARRLSKRRRDTSGTKAAAGDPPEHKQAKFYRGVTSEAWQSEASICRRASRRGPEDEMRRPAFFLTKMDTCVAAAVCDGAAVGAGDDTCAENFSPPLLPKETQKTTLFLSHRHDTCVAAAPLAD